MQPKDPKEYSEGHFGAKNNNYPIDRNINWKCLTSNDSKHGRVWMTMTKMFKIVDYYSTSLQELVGANTKKEKKYR